MVDGDGTVQEISNRHPNRSSPSHCLVNLDIPRVKHLIYADEGICRPGSSSLKRKISELDAGSNG